MNIKALGGVVAIILIAVGGYMLYTRSATPAESGSTTQTTNNSSSIGALVAAGKPVTCTFSTTTATGPTSGSIFVANGMLAADFTSVDSRLGQIQSHMITRDNTAYVWTSLSDQGFKSTVDANAATSNTSQGVDYNAQMDYQCSPWTPDTSKFTVPTNITFSSMGAATAPPSATSGQVQGSTGSGAGMSGSAAQCAQCDQLPASSKAQCRAALQCK